MRSDRPPDSDVVCAGFKCFMWSHEPFLIVWFCPGRTNCLDGDFDSVAELLAKQLDFTRTGHDSIDSCFCAYLGQTDYLALDGVCDSNVAQRSLGGAC